jgi:transcriptional regulator with XRE-family HTH domain
MKFAEFIKKNGLTLTELSEKLRVSIPTIYNVMKGKNYGFRLAKEIVKLSKNEVTLEDLAKSIRSF